MTTPEQDAPLTALNSTRFNSPMQEQLLAKYRDSPLARTGLLAAVVLSAVTGVGAIPAAVAAALETLALTSYDRHIGQRLQVLIDELDAERLEVTDELVSSEPFIHNVLRVIEASQRSRYLWKVRLYARLLAGYTDPTADHDEFDELIAQLEDISPKEFKLLLKVYNLERAYPEREDRNAAIRTGEYWPILQAYAHEHLGYNELELDAVLLGLRRTGMYVDISGQYHGPTYGRGHLTIRYTRLLERLRHTDTEDVDTIIT